MRASEDKHRHGLARLASRIGGYALSPVLVAVMSFVAVPVVSFVFPSDEYGKINMFYSTGMLLASFLTLGLENALMRFYVEPPDGLSHQSVLRIALILPSFITIVISLVAVLFFGQEIDSFLFGESGILPVVLLCVYSLCLTIMKSLNVEARMRDEIGRYNTQFISQNLISRLAFVIMAFVSVYYLYSISFMTICMAIITVIFLCLQFPRQSVAQSISELSRAKGLLAFGLPTMTSGLILQANAIVGKTVLTSHSLFSDVGIFAIATTLANIFAVIPSAFAIYWGPYMYKHYKDDTSRIVMVHDVVMVASIVMLCLIMMFQGALFSMVGEGYRLCQSYFMLIMLNPIQNFICETTSYGIVIAKKPMINALSSGGALLLNATVTITLMPSLGVLAAALGVALSSIFFGVVRTLMGQKLYRSIESPAKTVFFSLVLILLCFVNSITYSNMMVSIAIGVSVLVFSLLCYKGTIVKFVDSLKGRVKEG